MTKEKIEMIMDIMEGITTIEEIQKLSIEDNWRSFEIADIPTQEDVLDYMHELDVADQDAIEEHENQTELENDYRLNRI